MSRSRNYVFTWNKPTGLLDLSDFPNATYLIYTEEVGESGTHHLQGYVEFDRPKRITEINKNVPGIHLEPRKGTQDEAIAYVKKMDHTYIAGPYEFGTFKRQGQRVDLETFVAEMKTNKRKISEIMIDNPSLYARYRNGIRDIHAALQEPRNWEMEIYIRWGPPGTGKTRYIYDNFPRDQIFKKPEGPWWDGYENQPIVLIDDYDGHLSFTELLQLCDRYPHKVPVKGGFLEFNSKIIFFTSNIRPRQWYANISDERYVAFERRITRCEVIN